MALDELRAASRDGRLLFVGAERAMGGQARYSTREVGERVGVTRSSSWRCAARRACPCRTSTPSCARTPTWRRRRSRAGSWRPDRPGAAARGRAGHRARDGADGRGPADGGARARARARPQRGRTHAPLRRSRGGLHADDRADARVYGPPAPAPVGAHGGHQRRRAPGGRAAGRARRHRLLRRPRGLHAPGRAGRARRARARGRTAWSSSPPSACAATCAWSRRSATPRCSSAPTPRRCSRSRSTSSTRPTPRARTSRSCGSAWPRARAQRAGDWYGRPVNLASRVTSIARPGSVLTTREVRDAVGDGYRWSPAGPAPSRASTGRCGCTGRGGWCATTRTLRLRIVRLRLRRFAALTASSREGSRGGRARAAPLASPVPGAECRRSSRVLRKLPRWPGGWT